MKLLPALTIKVRLCPVCGIGGLVTYCEGNIITICGHWACKVCHGIGGTILK